MPYCPGCAHLGNPGPCPNCGEAIPSVNAPSGQNVSLPQRGLGAGKVALIVLASLGLLALVSYLGRSGSSQNASPTNYELGVTRAVSDDEHQMNQQIATGGTSCTLGQVKISNDRGRIDEEAGFVYVTGSIVNHCSEAVGVELKVTAFDKSGTVLDTTDEWPASVSNIAPGDYPFKAMMRFQAGMTKFSVVPIEVKRW